VSLERCGRLTKLAHCRYRPLTAQWESVDRSPRRCALTWSKEEEMERSTPIAALVATALLALGLAACGGDEEGEAGRVTTVAVTEEEPATKTGTDEIPADLVGTYKTRLPEGRFPAGTWRMAIGPRGELFITQPGETGFFATPVSVDGKTLVLAPDPDSGCGLEGRYTFELAGARPGGTLTLTAVEEPCTDREWVMGQEPWRRTD
jgi:hypothetical protein